MYNRLQSDVWQLWNSEMQSVFENSSTLCMAVFSHKGELIFANGAMEKLFTDTPVNSFINPGFDELVNIVTDELLIFSGFITFGSMKSSKNISIQSKVYRRKNQLLITGEVDVNQLIFINEKLFELNSEINDLQRKLLNEKKELTLTLEQLKESRERVVLSEQQIKRMLSEKELLLKEIHHRIKNNMITVAGFLSIQAENLKDSPAAEPLEDAVSRVRSMMVLYDKLYRSDDFDNISVQNYLPSLLDEILANFPGKKTVRIVKQIDDFILDAKRLLPLGIIINELMTNMMKYAFTGRDEGIITVSGEIKDDIVSFVVEDNGVGIPLFVDFKNSSGFGMKLVDMLTNQIGGRIKIERGEGTRFILEFKKYNKSAVNSDASS